MTVDQAIARVLAALQAKDTLSALRASEELGVVLNKEILAGVSPSQRRVLARQGWIV